VFFVRKSVRRISASQGICFPRVSRASCVSYRMGIPHLTIHGIRPAAVGKDVAAIYLGSKKLLERMLWATRHCPHDPWLELVANLEGDPKQKTLISAVSLERAAERYASGERPPEIGNVEPFEFEVEGRKFLLGPTRVMRRMDGKSI